MPWIITELHNQYWAFKIFQSQDIYITNWIWSQHLLRHVFITLPPQQHHHRARLSGSRAAGLRAVWVRFSSRSAGSSVCVETKQVVGIYVKMDLRKVFYASAVYIMVMIIMCELFLSFLHCIRSSVCFFFLDKFTSSPPYVALLSQIYFFIVWGSNALNVQVFKRGGTITTQTLCFCTSCVQICKNINKRKWN